MESLRAFTKSRRDFEPKLGVLQLHTQIGYFLWGVVPRQYLGAIRLPEDPEIGPFCLLSRLRTMIVDLPAFSLIFLPNIFRVPVRQPSCGQSHNRERHRYLQPPYHGHG